MDAYSEFHDLYIHMRTQNMAVGVNFYLGSQSTCIVGFEFPAMGGPILGNLSTLLFPQTLLFIS